MEPSQKPIFGVPVAIIIAGVLIAGAVYMSSRGDSVAPKNTAPTPTASGDIPEITAKDHLLGDPNATIKIVEYSDIDCPFCKRFHTTLHQVIDEYGKSSKVAWVYRHFPLDSLHPNARKKAEATECVADIGGNTKFWQYLDKISETTTANDGFSPAELSALASSIGVDSKAFDACFSSGKFASKVETQVKDAIKAGGRGTPFSVIVAKDQKVPITQGALPFADMKQLIDAILK
jgi:protein-disulfide isomerase